MEALLKNFSPEVGKCMMRGSIQVLPNQVNEKSFYTFKGIDLREFHAKLHKKPSENLEVIQFKG